jgi:hypothetical protein
MSKRNSPSVEEEFEYVEPKKEKTYRKLVLQIDAKYKVTGKYSGQEYLFSGAGSVNNVDEKDIEWMLQLRQGGRQCCGGSPDGNVVFRLAE